MANFATVSMAEFEERLYQALNDFIVRKEHVVSNINGKSVTTITFTKKSTFDRSFIAGPHLSSGCLSFAGDLEFNLRKLWIKVTSLYVKLALKHSNFILVVYNTCNTFQHHYWCVVNLLSVLTIHLCLCLYFYKKQMHTELKNQIHLLEWIVTSVFYFFIVNLLNKYECML